jgi:hypothetical protein
MDLLLFLPTYLWKVVSTWFGIVGTISTVLDLWRAGGGQLPSFLNHPRVLRGLGAAMFIVASASVYKQFVDSVPKDESRIAEISVDDSFAARVDTGDGFELRVVYVNSGDTSTQADVTKPRIQLNGVDVELRQPQEPLPKRIAFAPKHPITVSTGSIRIGAAQVKAVIDGTSRLTFAQTLEYEKRQGVRIRYTYRGWLNPPMSKIATTESSWNDITTAPKQ